jgi:GNAT superfamily N-acetyltransferase
MRHPEHEAVAAEVASWYTTPAPGMGYLLEDRWCGLFTTQESLIGPRVILRVKDPADVRRAVQDIAATYGEQPVDVWLEGRDAMAELESALLAAGCRPRVRTVYLALVGAMRPASPPPGLHIEMVDADGLREWAAVRHMGFANNEDQPNQERLDHEVSLQRVEQADVGRFWLARLDGEAAGALAFYDGDDRLVHTLATRVPHRGRGVAQALLAAFVADSTRQECRSMLINAVEADWPVGLYRRIGFSDEILVHGRYVIGES